KSPGGRSGGAYRSRRRRLTVHRLDARGARGERGQSIDPGDAAAVGARRICAFPRHLFPVRLPAGSLVDTVLLGGEHAAAGISDAERALCDHGVAEYVAPRLPAGNAGGAPELSSGGDELRTV